MRYNDKGEEVRATQKALIAQGYSLPKYGADGHLGNETWETLQRYARDHGVRWNPEVPQAVIGDIYTVTPEPVVPPAPPLGFGHVRLYDLRSEQTDPPKKSHKFRCPAGKVVRRNPAFVTGITIHQCAAKFGVAQYQIDAAVGDRDLALARRSLGVACHAMAFHDGFVAWANPLDWYVYHGNSPFNASELGLEIDGNYPGLIGGPTWDGKPVTPVTATVVEAACAAIELLVREGRALGMPIEFIHAHRQSSSSRRADPGEELWKRVVLDYAVPVLGLIPEQGVKFRDGRTIPTEWDDAGVGSY